MEKQKEERVLEKDIAIDKDDIDSEFIRLPSLYSYWARKKNDYEDYLNVVKIEFEIWFSKKKHEVNKRHALKSDKSREDYVILDYEKEYFDWRDKISQTERNLENLKTMVESLKIKKDMLVSLGANMREDFKQQGLSIRNVKK
jgi:hypothetical protein